MTLPYPYAEAYITDGTAENTINLLNPFTGVHLANWVFAVSDTKSIMLESPITDGGRIVSRRFKNAHETIEFDIDGLDQDAIARDVWQMFQVLERGMAYFTGSVVRKVMYLKVRPSMLSNYQYAVLYDYSIPDIGQLLFQPFSNEKPALSALNLDITRGHWIPSPPHEPAYTPCGSYGDVLEADVSGTSYSISSFEAYSSFITSTGTILVGGLDNVYRSANGGASWSAIALATANRVLCFFQASNGNLFCGSSVGIHRSTNDGASWSLVLTAGGDEVTEIWEYAGRLYAGQTATTNMYRTSSLTGASGTWSTYSAYPHETFPVQGVVVKNSRIVAGDYYSDDGAATWHLSESGYAGLTHVQLLSTGVLVAVNSLDVFLSYDSGETWENVYRIGAISSLSKDPYTDELYVGTWTGGTTGGVLRSINGGISWTTQGNFGTNPVYGVGVLSDKSFLVAGTEVYKLTRKVTAIEAQGDERMGYPVANKYETFPITHVLYYDASAGTYTTIDMNTLPASLLPVTPASGDRILFGSNVGGTSRTFSNLVFNLSEVPLVNVAWSPEYTNGAGWNAISVRTTTGAPGQNFFSKLGVGVVSWDTPTAWATQTLGGVTCYWFSFLYPAVTPTAGDDIVQSDWPVFTAKTNWLNVESGDVGGNIYALARVMLRNVSDLGGRMATTPTFPINRVIMGLRSYERGDHFVSHLNASDEQNVFGVTVSLGTNCSFVSGIAEAANRYVLYNPAGAESLGDRVSFRISSNVAKHWSGRFKAFVKVSQTSGGTAGYFKVAVKVLSSMGAISYTTPQVATRSEEENEVLEFTSIRIRTLSDTEISDDITVTIQASAVGNAADLHIKGLVLMPADEMIIDATDVANTNYSALATQYGWEDLDNLLDIDSASQYKRRLQAVTRNAATPSRVEVSTWRPVSATPAFLQSNAHQRLFFLFMEADAVGSNPVWVSRPHALCAVQLYTHPCYLGLIGDQS